MNFTGAFINSIGVFLAGILGSLFKKSISEKMKNALMMGLGFCVLYIGISGISADTNVILLLISISIARCTACRLAETSKIAQLNTPSK